MTAVCFDDTAPLRLCVFLDDSAGIAECHSGLDEWDRVVKAFASGLHDANRGGVGKCGGANVVGFVEVAVESAVVKGDVEVDDVAVKKDAAIRDAVADDLIDGRADGFGKVDVVKGGWI